MRYFYLILGLTALLLPGLASAYWQSRDSNYDISVSSGGGGGGTANWSTTDKNGLITVTTTTNTNDTGTSPASATPGWIALRGATGYAVGTNNKVIFSLNVTINGVTNGWIGGLATSNMSLSSYVGATGNSLGFQIGVADYTSGSVTENGGDTCHGVDFTMVGDTGLIAIDFNTGKLWCGGAIGSSNPCSGGWSGSVGNGNPDSGTNQAYTLGAGTWYPAWSGYQDTVGGDAAIINTKPTFSGCANVSTFTTWTS